MDLYVRHGARARGCLGRLAYGGKRVAATLAGPVISLFARRPPGRRIPSDVLLLHGYDGGLRRAAGLRRALEDLGLAVADHILETRLQRLLRRRFGHPGHRVPLRWRLDAYYAGYLLWRYAPKIVVCSEYRSPLVACLRLACAGRAKLINIAHSVVPIFPSDTPEELHARIQIAEHELYPAVIRRFASQLAGSKPEPS